MTNNENPKGRVCSTRAFDKRTERDIQLFLLTKGIITERVPRRKEKTPDFSLSTGEALEVTNIHPYRPKEVAEFTAKREFEYGWNSRVLVRTDYDGTIKLEEAPGQTCQNNLSVITYAFDVSSHRNKISRAIENKYPQIEIRGGGIIALTFRSACWKSKDLKREVDWILLNQGHKYPLLMGVLVGVQTNTRIPFGVIECFFLPNPKRGVQIPKCLRVLRKLPESAYKKFLTLEMVMQIRKPGWNPFNLPPMKDPWV
jgi:hypothetical protein